MGTITNVPCVSPKYSLYLVPILYYMLWKQYKCNVATPLKHSSFFLLRTNLAFVVDTLKRLFPLRTPTISSSLISE